jgi:hypothetical protein
MASRIIRHLDSELSRLLRRHVTDHPQHTPFPCPVIGSSPSRRPGTHCPLRFKRVHRRNSKTKVSISTALWSSHATIHDTRNRTNPTALPPPSPSRIYLLPISRPAESPKSGTFRLEHPPSHFTSAIRRTIESGTFHLCVMVFARSRSRQKRAAGKFQGQRVGFASENYAEISIFPFPIVSSFLFRFFTSTALPLQFFFQYFLAHKSRNKRQVMKSHI